LATRTPSAFDFDPDSDFDFDFDPDFDSDPDSGSSPAFSSVMAPFYRVSASLALETCGKALTEP
jgi:hypothetical protein